MNSSNDTEFDQKLDQLLSASVAPGSEPAELSVIRLPQRPRFNWVMFSVAALAFVLIMALLIKWILVSHEGGGEMHTLAGQEMWHLLSEGMLMGVERLCSPLFLQYAAPILAVVYFFFARSIMRLCRHY